MNLQISSNLEQNDKHSENREANYGRAYLVPKFVMRRYQHVSNLYAFKTLKILGLKLYIPSTAGKRSTRAQALMA